MTFLPPGQSCSGAFELEIPPEMEAHAHARNDYAMVLGLNPGDDPHNP